MNQTKTQDILAKLLATENITILRGHVRTASFDIKNRVLTLPRWKDMTPSIEEMLLLHEVGHALFTGLNEFESMFTNKPHLKDYVNVIEDVRIEKKMKERYPGSRKSFNAGYKELNQRSFFVPPEKDLSKLLLIDRINIYFKVGYGSDVKFTEEEYAIINRVDKCDTEAEVMALAEELYGFSKNQKEEEARSQRKASSKPTPKDDIAEEEEFEDEQTEFLEDSEASDSNSQSSKSDDSEPLSKQDEELIEKSLKSKTVENSQSQIDKMVDEVSDYKYYDLKFEYESREDSIIDYKRVQQELGKLISQDVLESTRNSFMKFKSENAPMVNYLIKEFEMRKSATAYKRAKVSRLGQLDPRKLYAYKIKEDLFKQITTIQNGKKHGMIFLLDWSGSMRDYIEETIKQVINLAMFCQRTQIPYQVLAFTDGYLDSEYTSGMKPSNVNGVDSQSSFKLLELYSHRMTSSEFNRQTHFMLSRPYTRSNYKLNGTPLNSSLLYMVDYIGKFKRDYQVEKLSIITLTDGESNPLHAYGNPICDGMTYVNRNGVTQRVDRKSFFHDHVTKKNYAITDNPCQQTGVLLQVIRDRYDASSIGFFVCSGNPTVVGSFIRHNLGDVKGVYELKTSLVEQLKRHKHAILKTVPGRDELYLLSSENIIREFDINGIGIEEDMTSSQISQKLTKAMSSQKQSRIVMNSFIEKVA